MARMRVEVAGRVTEIAENERLTFGRSRECGICLDPEDTGISRITGTVSRESGTWWLANSSGSRPLAVVDELGFRSLLPPGRRIAVEAPTKVLVDGTRRRHDLALLPPSPAPSPAPAPARSPEGTASASPGPAPDGTGTAVGSTPTAVGAEVMVNAADRLAMVALFAGYLEEPPRYDPYPKDYAAAAARIGCSRTALVKRVEYLRTRLDAAGVPNMKGFNALVNLAEYAISRGLVTREDLALLRR
ncbi:hypothetical protein [Streptosporangium carneum]|uniref:FHA domain-containing protein n=1 Tax=Streptosporangium carneum TaxID=47481 RepID=A0A9W6HY50_9ACTN|nr:hypothetical protein [Streptosporangium carneum]GLK07534.1 hypothetical protein GCM10017600_09390 [Streptosporangium carneum]